MVTNNAAEGENKIKYASSYPMNWAVKNWFVQDLKGHGHDTDKWSDYDKWAWIDCASKFRKS